MFTAKRRSKRLGTRRRRRAVRRRDRSRARTEPRRRAAARRRARVRRPARAPPSRTGLCGIGEREVVAAARRHRDRPPLAAPPPGLSRAVDRDDTEARPREGEAAKRVRRVDEPQPNRRARRDARRSSAVAGAEQRHAAERVRERDDVGSSTRRRGQHDERAVEPALDLVGRMLVRVVPVRARRTARGSGRRTSSPAARCPASRRRRRPRRSGRSTPCQWIDTPSRTCGSRASPRRARPRGRGARGPAGARRTSAH